MANPRQRSKAKSHKSTKPSLTQKRRIHSKLRKAPPLKGPEALQTAWDKKKTVFQNYAALGLLPSMSVAKEASTSRQQRVELPLIPGSMDIDELDYVPKQQFGRIIRDADGNVIDIIIDEEDEETKGKTQEEIDEENRTKPLNDEESAPEVVLAKTDVVKQLEAIAATTAPVIRHTSSAEKEWLTTLVQKHGDDFASAAMDRRLNVWQKTPGELKRMVRKAGGVAKLTGA